MSLEEENNIPSDSDSDDDDYVPTGAGEAVSEDESGNESNDEEGGSGEDTKGVGKRTKSQKKSKKSRKKIKPVDEKENEEEKPNEELSFDEKKKRASSLWEDFMKDVGSTVVKKKADEPVKKEDKPKEEKKEVKAPTPQQPAKVKITELFEFAGEKVEVEREVVASSVSSPLAESSRGGVKASAGISSILGQLGKKGKLSTLEKSKLDWDKFKKQEGIDEQLDTFNKGKNGFLEKQDFLQRADLRQFEIEKEMRNKRRSSNR